MMDYTPNWLFCWINRGPWAWAWLRLLLAMCVLVAPWATDANPWLPLTAEPWYLGRRLSASYWGWRLGWSARMLWRIRWQVVARCSLLLVLLELSGVRKTQPLAQALVWLPVVDGLLHSGGCLGVGRRWGGVYRQVQQGVRSAYRASVWGLSLLSLARMSASEWDWLALGGVVVCERDNSRVTMEREVGSAGQTTYRVQLSGEFVMAVTPRDALELRLLILFLRCLRTPGRAASRWGIVRQEALATVCEVKQEEISRWQRYLRQGQWAQLLSLTESSWLSEDVCQAIVAVWAPNIWQTAVQVQARLAAQGVQVALRTVEEAGRRSGLQTVRQHVQQQYRSQAPGLRPRDEYVVQQLFRLVDELTARLKSAGLVQEAQVDVSALRQWVGRAESEPRTEKPWPWLFQIEHWLWGAWQETEDEVVRCPYCGSSEVARKSKTPRWKAYVDAQGERQKVAVYRYYCKNPACSYQSFTNLPAGVVLHSVWTVDARLKGLELYMGLGSSYRRAAGALDVSASTLYHWLSYWGREPLQIASLLGMVRSSGVVGIDEKYVLILKNDKPGGKYQKWMYVYVAVDMHTLDLLHIQVFPYLGQTSARTFLLELRAKGYQPRVIVTDLCADYLKPLAAVFPGVTHHECVFHAQQAWHRQFREAFGDDYARTAPQFLALRQQLDRVFQAKTRRTVQQRYVQWRTQCDAWLSTEPRLQPIVDSVVRHYPRLVNAYEHPLIPLTNNATERLIRRFDQHYQNFAGFDSLATARGYAYLFELYYRFTPFGNEVQPHLRGRCPLELAGYDLSQVPLARYLREHSRRPVFPDPPQVVPR